MHIVSRYGPRTAVSLYLAPNSVEFTIPTHTKNSRKPGAGVGAGRKWPKTAKIAPRFKPVTLKRVILPKRDPPGHTRGRGGGPLQAGIALGRGFLERMAGRQRGATPLRGLVVGGTQLGGGTRGSQELRRGRPGSPPGKRRMRSYQGRIGLFAPAVAPRTPTSTFPQRTAAFWGPFPTPFPCLPPQAPGRANPAAPLTET